MKMMLFVLLFGRLATVGAIVTDESTPSRIAGYDFTRDDCFNKTFSNSGALFLDLQRSENTTTCSPGLGVESIVSFSTPGDGVEYLNTNGTSIGSLLDYFQSNVSGITFELWIKPLDESSDSRLRPILTFGVAVAANTTTSLGTPGLTECDDQQMDFQLNQHGDSLEMIYHTSDANFEPCHRFRLVNMPLRLGQINHVVVALRDNHQQIFINGESSIILSEPFDNKLGHWNRQDGMHFFSYPKRSPWYGHLYRFSIYDSVLDASKVQSLLAGGLPRSRPYALTKTLTMYEDAEILPGSHNTEWYKNARNFEKDGNPEIALTIGSVDVEVNSLLRELNVTQDLPRRSFLYITKLPDRGTLHQVDGTSILSDASASVVPVVEESVVFLPVHNQYSDLPGSSYASFDYCVTDHEIFTPIQCESETISIVVDPVNDPPSAMSFPEVVLVQEGVSEVQGQVIELSGVDIDDGDHISTVQITTLPRLGYLILSVSTFRGDGLLHGTLLSELNNTLQDQVAYLEYRFDGADQVVQDGSVMDSFDFRVSDSSGAWSEEKRVAVQVVPGVRALPSTSFNLLEDTIQIIEFHGRDASGLRRKIGYFIESVPAEGEGRLYESGNELVKAGTMLSTSEEYPYDNGGNITFEPAPSYCTTHPSQNVTIGYRIVALVGERVTSSTSVKEMVLHINCVIDPLVLNGPETAYSIQTFEGLSDDPCSGYAFNESEIDADSCPSAAIISGIQVTSQDVHSEEALVSISANYGLLTLNRNFWNSLTPVSDQEEVRPTIIFYALPKNLNSILSYLHFQSDVPGEDAVRIAIHYGNCSFDGSTLHTIPPGSDCQILTHTIPIEVREISSVSAESYVFRTFQWRPLPFTFLLLLFIKVKGKVKEKFAKPEVYEVEKDKDELYKAEEDPSVEQTLETEGSSISCRWIQFYDAESGFYFYQNGEDGEVTWDPPLDEEFIPAEEEEEASTRGMVEE
jgi:hypothetical protein